MKWKILNVSIPVKDIDKSRIFYEMILGKPNKIDTISKSIFNEPDAPFFGYKGFGIRLFKIKPNLFIENKLQSRRSFVTILVDKINPIIDRLKKNDYKYILKDKKKIRSLFVREPSLNLIHFVENIDVIDFEIDIYDMGLSWGIHHMNLESLDVRESVDFFCNIIGMKEGRWKAPTNKGDFSTNPSELSILPNSVDNKGLHIIKPDPGFGFRNNFIHNPSIGGHPAFTVKDINLLIKKLQKQNVLYSDAKVYAMPGFHQIYLYDNNANMLEINEIV